MLRLARIVLTCLIALALPLQGMAASAMRSCGAGVPTWLLPSFSVHAHAAGDSPAHPVHGHDAMNGAHHHVESVATQVTAGDQAAKPNHARSCSACAFCCAGFFVAPEQMLFRSGEWHAADPPGSTRTPAAFLTSGIERPPRSVRT